MEINNCTVYKDYCLALEKAEAARKALEEAGDLFSAVDFMISGGIVAPDLEDALVGAVRIHDRIKDAIELYEEAEWSA